MLDIESNLQEEYSSVQGFLEVRSKVKLRCIGRGSSIVAVFDSVNVFV